MINESKRINNSETDGETLAKKRMKE